MDWMYKNEYFTDDMIGDYTSFVYIITNNVHKKQYIGKKKFNSYRNKKIAGRKNRKKIVSPSDWKNYYGSNLELKEDVKILGKDFFTREILYLCKTVGESSYYEAFEQFKHEVLLKPDKFYNRWIQCKIHHKHLPRSIS